MDSLFGSVAPYSCYLDTFQPSGTIHNTDLDVDYGTTSQTYTIHALQRIYISLQESSLCYLSLVLHH